MEKRHEHLKLYDELSRALPFISSFFETSAAVHLALLSPDGRMRQVNLTLADCLKTRPEELVDQDFLNFLTTQDAETLTRLLASPNAWCDEKFLLNVVDTDQIPHSLHFRITSIGVGFLLLGEPPQLNNQTLQEELLQLNNQLAVLSRENVRKGRELKRTLTDLKKTQVLLVHREKMASLGQMTAGIAHEINNPLAFVLGNEQVLQRDFNDLLAFINTIGDALPEIETLAPDLHADVLAKAAEIDLEYLAEALPHKIVANIEGLERVKKIILDLRNFSRLDEAERKLCSLTEGIEATLRFLGPLLHEHGVSITTEFANLPQVLCMPGPLNQAVSNILANAIQASVPGQTVQVSTRLEDDDYCIEVSDQGAGISPEHQNKVFDPFFTTKPVGSGTGLGLSIAHQIVATQGGRIEIESLPGKGTTVRILLPGKNSDGSNHSTKEQTHGSQ